MLKRKMIAYLLVISLVFLTGYNSSASGKWQSRRAVKSLQGRSAKDPKSQWLVLDTGGSGGGFGKGDIRQHLRDVFFWDKDLGWACGYSGVFKTVNGGISWTRKKQGSGWYHVEMTGPEEVWLLEGFHGKGKACLWHTADDGKSWQEIMPNTFKGYKDLYCRAGQLWVICGDFYSFRSTDNGKNWQKVKFGKLSGVYSIAIPADVPTEEGYVMYAFGHSGRIPTLVKSIDGGKTWKNLKKPGAINNYLHSSLFFPNSQTGWFSGGKGKIFYTADGGKSWMNRSLPTDQRIQSIWFDQMGNGFAAVLNNSINRSKYTLYETNNGGKTGSRFWEAKNPFIAYSG